MRHLGSLLLSLVLTAAWYVVLGLGLSQFTKHALDVRLVDKLVLALAFLVAGVLYGLTVLLRLSPVGLVISGLALAVLGFWSLFDIGGEGPFTILPTGIGGFHNSLVLPVDYAAFAAIPLLLTVFSPRRWRRYATPQAAPLNPPVPVPGAAPAGGYPPPGAYGSPAASSPYGTPVSVPPADPYGSPVSPAGAPAGPEGTRLLPGAGSGSGSSFGSGSGSSYGSPGSGSGFGSSGSSFGSSAYPPPPPPPAGSGPVWPPSTGRNGLDDPEQTRPI